LPDEERDQNDRVRTVRDREPRTARSSPSSGSTWIQWKSPVRRRNRVDSLLSIVTSRSCEILTFSPRALVRRAGENLPKASLRQRSVAGQHASRVSAHMGSGTDRPSASSEWAADHADVCRASAGRIRVTLSSTAELLPVVAVRHAAREQSSRVSRHKRFPKAGVLLFAGPPQGRAVPPGDYRLSADQLRNSSKSAGLQWLSSTG